LTSATRLIAKNAAPILLLLIASLPPAVRAQTPSDSITTPAEASYWGGAAPAPEDTALARFRNPRRPLWEGAIYWPVRVASFPLALAARGIGSGIEVLDDSKVIYRFGRLLAPRRGPFGVLLDLRAGGISGFGGGFTAEHGSFLGNGNLFRLRAETTTRSDHRLNLGIRVPSARDGGTEVGLGYRARAYARYFGVGPATTEDAESFYRQEAAWAGLSHRIGLGSGVHVQGDVLYSSIAAGASGSKEHPSIETEYAGDLPAGYGYHSFGWTVGAQLSQENGPGPGRATHGGLRRVRASRFIGTSADDAEFWSFRGEAQQYFTLFFPYRVLALRGFASWIESSEGGVPFQRLLSNDDPDLLRGYEDFRFRDRGMAVLSAEYRWPVWTNETPDGPGVDLYLLSDLGQVFHDTEDLGGGNLTVSYGGGLRLESTSGFRARLELAWSEEQMMFRLRADQIFQFLKGSLYFGRDPVPDR
jgi:hypothetical protein